MRSRRQNQHGTADIRVLFSIFDTFSRLNNIFDDKGVSMKRKILVSLTTAYPFEVYSNMTACHLSMIVGRNATKSPRTSSIVQIAFFF